MVASGAKLAPAPNMIPSIIIQNSGLSFANNLIVRLKVRTFIDTKQNPDKKSMIVKLRKLKLRLHKNKEIDIIKK